MKTAWYNQDVLPKEMVNGALGVNGWSRLEHTEHFEVLKNIINQVDVRNMADLGCGAAELGRLYKNTHNYTGFDLPHIIEKVAKVVNPKNNYVYFDAYEFDYSKLSEYDMIVCNSFISELYNPLQIIEKLLTNMGKYLIVHRQFFTKNTEFVDYNTYGNLKTIRSHLNYDDFTNLLINHNLIEKKDNVWGSTILIEKCL